MQGPSLQSNWDNDNSAFEDDGTWNSLGTIILLGGLVPLVLLAWVVIQIIGGEVIIPARRGGDIALSLAKDPVSVLGLLAMETLFAAYFVTKYVVGNHPR